MNISFCKDFRLEKTSHGYMAVTPLRYYDNDQVVVFARRADSGNYLVTDNGETAMRLALDGVDTEAPRISQWLMDLDSIFGVHWSSKDQELFLEATEAELSKAILRVAESASQFQAMTCLRPNVRAENLFREELLSQLHQVSLDTNIEIKLDVPVDDAQQFRADALFLSPTPLAVVIASTKERLLEAELMWTNAQRMNDPTRVMAVVESAEKVGRKEVDRANYFTTKTVVYRDFEKIFPRNLKDALA